MNFAPGTVTIRRNSASSAAATRRNSPAARPRAALEHLATLATSGPVTLLTATRDIDHSQAAVLAELLRRTPADESAEGGDAACWAHLVCPECGAITTGGHRPGCTSA